MEEQHNISLYEQPPKEIAPMKGTYISSVHFSETDITFFSVHLYITKSESWTPPYKRVKRVLYTIYQQMKRYNHYQQKVQCKPTNKQPHNAPYHITTRWKDNDK